MPRPLLPPKGIFVPATLLYDKDLQPVVRDTWARLRGLAWGRNETPALGFNQLCDLLGLSRSTLYGHMLILRDRAALQWRAADHKTLIVSFEGCADDLSENLDKPSLLSTPPKKPSEKAKEGGGEKPAETETPPAIAVYRTICRLFPDKAVWPQIVQIVGQESENLDRWQKTIEGWIAAGHFKKNVGGMLDWFQQGKTSKGAPIKVNGNGHKPVGDQNERRSTRDGERSHAAAGGGSGESVSGGRATDIARQLSGRG